jgi:hypothetical protein
MLASYCVPRTFLFHYICAYGLVFVYEPLSEGRYQDVLELVFYDVKRMKVFIIIRKLSAIVGSQDDHEDLAPKRPYARRKFIPLPLDGFIIRGMQPPTWTHTKWVTRLPPFEAPPEHQHYGKENCEIRNAEGVDAHKESSRG